MSIEEFDRQIDDMRRQVDEALRPVDAVSNKIGEVAERMRLWSEQLAASVAKAARPPMPVDLPWQLPTRKRLRPMVFRPKPEGLIYVDLDSGDYTPDELEQLGAVLIAAAWVCRREQGEPGAV